MPRRLSTRRETKRMDALLALPLARFRTALKHLTPDELTALETRIALQMIRNRWALGSHGLDRHRAPHTLGLLTRRQAEVARQRETRRAPVAAQLRLVDVDRTIPALETPVVTERAA